MGKPESLSDAVQFLYAIGPKGYVNGTTALLMVADGLSQEDAEAKAKELLVEKMPDWLREKCEEEGIL